MFNFMSQELRDAIIALITAAIAVIFMVPAVAVYDFLIAPVTLLAVSVVNWFDKSEEEEQSSTPENSDDDMFKRPDSPRVTDIKKRVAFDKLDIEISFFKAPTPANSPIELDVSRLAANKPKKSDSLETLPSSSP